MRFSPLVRAKRCKPGAHGVPAGTSFWVPTAITEATAIHGVALGKAVMSTMP